MTAIRQRDQRIGAVRRFNRFYTRQIGVLRKTFLDSPYSLAEVRVDQSPPAAAPRPRPRSAARSISMPAISAACCAISRNAA